MLNVEPVLIICEEGLTRERISATTRRCGVRSVSCSSVAEARTLLAKQTFSVVFCNDQLCDGSFREAIAAAKPAPVVVLSRLAEWEPFLVALGAGAFDYLVCPPNNAENERILWCALKESSKLHKAASVAAA